MVPVATRCLIPDLAEAKGWSLGELSRRAGISKATVAAYARMRTKDMPLKNAISIAAALGVRPEDLYEWDWRCLF